MAGGIDWIKKNIEAVKVRYLFNDQRSFFQRQQELVKLRKNQMSPGMLKSPAAKFERLIQSPPMVKELIRAPITRVNAPKAVDVRPAQRRASPFEFAKPVSRAPVPKQPVQPRQSLARMPPLPLRPSLSPERSEMVIVGTSLPPQPRPSPPASSRSSRGSVMGSKAAVFQAALSPLPSPRVLAQNIYKKVSAVAPVLIRKPPVPSFQPKTPVRPIWGYSPSTQKVTPAPLIRNIPKVTKPTELWKPASRPSPHQPHFPLERAVCVLNSSRIPPLSLDAIRREPERHPDSSFASSQGRGYEEGRSTYEVVEGALRGVRKVVPLRAADFGYVKGFSDRI